MQLRHLEQDQGREGKGHGEQVEHLRRILGKMGQAAQPHAQKEKGEGEDEIFHFSLRSYCLRRSLGCLTKGAGV